MVVGQDKAPVSILYQGAHAPGCGPMSQTAIDPSPANHLDLDRTREHLLLCCRDRDGIFAKRESIAAFREPAEPDDGKGAKRQKQDGRSMHLRSFMLKTQRTAA
jgi:hypothetical protein